MGALVSMTLLSAKELVAIPVNLPVPWILLVVIYMKFNFLKDIHSGLFFTTNVLRYELFMTIICCRPFLSASLPPHTGASTLGVDFLVPWGS